MAEILEIQNGEYQSFSSPINRILIAVISFELLLKLVLIIRYKIGWDEFFFLSKIYSYQRGDLTEPFQNFHVHLLGWVPRISENEIFQIIGARCLLFLLFVGSAVLLYHIALNFLGRIGSLFSVFCWLSISNVIFHGSSLRADSFCTFLFLLACFALIRRKRQTWWAIAAGCVAGISLLISLKAAIHLMALLTLLIALCLASREKSKVVRNGLVFSFSITLTFLLGFFVHQGSMPTANSPAQESYVHDVSSKAVIFNKFFPKFGYFAQTLFHDPVIWWLIGVGIFYTIFDYKRDRDPKRLIALSFLVPILSLPFYKNAFPYFYTFIMAPAVMFCGILPQRLFQDFQKSASKALLIIFAVIALPIAGGAGFHFFKAFEQDNNPQIELFNVVHKMFPNPVPYIDGCSAVASFPKVGFFMSNWGFENYLADGSPIFREILLKDQPKFILANTPHLNFNLSRDQSFFRINYDFLEEDRKILEENFIKFWGMLWLPGKVLRSKTLGVKNHFEILIPGSYILKSTEQSFIDGKSIMPGEKFFLEKGDHTVRSLHNNQEITIHWAGVSHTPNYPPPSIFTFYGF